MTEFTDFQVPEERVMGYPRICAHRGMNLVAPENSLPAYGAAVAMGSEEIEFDVRSTLDGVLVSCHDTNLERVSNGSGTIEEHTYEELLKLDFGIRFSPEYAGLKILTFEEILKRFSRRVILNIHVKVWNGFPEKTYMEEIAGLIRKYGAEKHCYMMSSNTKLLLKFREIAPEIALCQGHTSHAPERIVDIAIENGIEKVQFYEPEFFKREALEKAKEHGVRCNYFYADAPEKAVKLLCAGVDTILTNRYLQIANAVDEAFPGARPSAR